MRRLIGLCLVMALVATLAAPAFAQGEKRIRYSGTIILVSHDKSTFTIQKDNLKIPMSFDAQTVFTTRNKPGASAQDLKEGRRVICLVDAAQKDNLVARRVDFRTDK